MSSGSPIESGERPRSMIAKAGTLLLIGALIAGVFATITALSQRGRAQPSTAALAAPLSINTADAAIYCPTQAFFSPDGATIAVLGAMVSCHATNMAPGLFGHVLAFYDRRSGNLMRTLSLDALIDVNDQTKVAAQTVRGVRYVALGWSPNGTLFALAYAAFDVPRGMRPDDLVDTGLLLLNTKTLAGRIISGDAGFFAASTSTYGGLPIWNLAARSVAPPEPAPAGLAYAWSANGAPEAILPLTGATLPRLPITAGSRYPVGDPDGDPTYTVWQPGMLLGPQANRSVLGLQPTQDALISIFPAWSPDGTRVTLMVAGVALPVSAMVAPATEVAPAPMGPVLPAPQTLTQVPARDAALQAVQDEVGQDGWALVGWNVAGTQLASVACLTTGETLRLWATDSGHLLGELPVPLGAGDHGCAATAGGEQLGDYPSPNLWLQWAPDGSGLLLTDQTAATVTVWDVR
jgi:hypothetical protein